MTIWRVNDNMENECEDGESMIIWIINDNMVNQC